MARIVGLDVGERRIGLALSDASGTLARPLGVVAVKALDGTAAAAVLQALARHVEPDETIEGVVVGFPRRLDGSTTPFTTMVQAFAAVLNEQTGYSIHWQDERLTSREAEARLAIREKDWRARKARLDAAAAAIILQDFLDARRAAAAVAGNDDCDPDADY